MNRRGIYIALFASLALNLFILGAAAGALLLGEHFHHQRAMFRGGPPMFQAAMVLPPAERDAYAQMLRAAAADAGPKLRDARAVRHDAWAKLETDPVDAAAVTADLDRARALEAQAREDVDHRIVDFAARLPSADRARLAAALATPPHRGPHGGRPPGPPPPP